MGFDESEINKTSELEIIVKASDKEDGILLRSLLGLFDKDGIDYKNKLVAVMTDRCNTMQGHRSGVKKRLTDIVPQCYDLGSCNDHHISNALKHAVESFDSDIQQALVNIYCDLGGAKGRGLKRKKAFEIVCQEKGIIPIPFKKFCSTRFRSVRECLKPVLFNWEALVQYYSKLKSSTDRQKLLKIYFVDREFSSLLELRFINASIRELIEAIDFFEMRSGQVHTIRKKMEELLRNQILKFHSDNAVTEADIDLETVVKKSGVKLLELDLDDKNTLLNKKKIFIGQDASKLIKSLGLNPNSPQLNKFFENVGKFHKTVCSQLQIYFKIGLQSTELEYMCALCPKNVRSIYTTHQLNFLSKRFSKVVENIQPVEGLDRIKEEIDNYVLDDEVTMSGYSFEDFWSQVSLLTEGDNHWEKYTILPRFALSLGTTFNSNSETERAFSVETDIHRDPKRNQMSQETFDSHMQVHYGVEDKKSRDSCDKCVKHKAAKIKAPHHCHCTIAEISEKMIENSKTAWIRQKAQTVENRTGDIEKAELQKKEVKSKEESEKRLLILKEGMKSRATFYARSSAMPKVFEVAKKKVVSNTSAAATSSSKVVLPKNKNNALSAATLKINSNDGASSVLKQKNKDKVGSTLSIKKAKPK